MSTPGYLHLSDNTSFDGSVINLAKGSEVHGEVVFNTAMAGYVESLTDPSYSNQILVFTYPLIGNYGIQKQDFESKKIHARAVVVNQLSMHPNHHRSFSNLGEWLASQGVPLIHNVDTRALTLHLRNKGVMDGKITNQENKGKIASTPHKFITTPEVIIHNPSGKKTVVLVDCGTKENILKSIIELDVKVIQVPYNYDYSGLKFDGVLLSNGPGNPTSYKETIATTKKAVKVGKPIFGICLGNQLLALANGASTYKLPFGHRGQNQPCKIESSDQCFITSQNHGYAIKEKSLPKNWKVLFRNLNDNSIEGIEHTSKPFFSVQFHPEAKPGPTDTSWLFNKFVESL